MSEILFEDLEYNDFTAANPAKINISQRMGFESGFPPHWHKALEITLCIKNPIRLIADGHAHEIKEGDILYVNSGIIHATEACDLNRRIAAVVVLIPDNLLREVIPEYDNGFFEIPAEHSDRRLLAACLQTIYDLKLKESTSSIPWINAALWELIGILTRFFVPGREKSMIADQRNILAQKALSYIDEHFAEELTLLDVSSQVGLQENYFCRYFKRCVGMSFVQYLARVRLRCALSYLTDLGLSVTESAVRAGFPSEKAFTNWCRRVQGMTPSEYRRFSEEKI